MTSTTVSVWLQECVSQLRQYDKSRIDRISVLINETAYLHDLDCAPFHVSHIFTDVDDLYCFFNTLLKQIMDQHAPIKHKTIKAKQLPYMNDILRKAINVKGHLRRKHNAMKTNSTWNKYRAQRNLVTMYSMNIL